MKVVWGKKTIETGLFFETNFDVFSLERKNRTFFMGDMFEKSEAFLRKVEHFSWGACLRKVGGF